MKKIRSFIQQFTTALWLRVVLLAVVFGLVGVSLSLIVLRLDLSRGRAYTLAPSTQSVLRNLEKEATVTFFVSAQPPSQILPAAREVTDLLDEYRRGAGENVKVRIHRIPKDSPQDEQAAAEYGIAPRQLSQRERDTFAVTNVFFGIGVESNGQKQSIGDATNLSNLEYAITSTLYKMQAKELPRVGYMGGDGVGLDAIIGLRSLLESQFKVDEISTPEASISAMMIMDDGVQVFDEEGVDQLRQYVSGGGNILAFVNGVSFDQNLEPQDATHGLFGILREWGIDLQKNLILSDQAEYANLGGGGGEYQVLAPYPFWVQSNILNRETPYFNNVAVLTYPWVSSLEIDENKAMDVVRTSDLSWQQTKDFTIDPQLVSPPQQSELQSFVVGAVTKPQGDSGKVFVIPSTHFALDQFNSQRLDNLELSLNVMTEFASGGALSGIRARAINIYPLPALNADEKDAFKYVMILLLPGLWGMLGAWRLYRRK